MRHLIILVCSLASISALGTPHVPTTEKIVINYATSRPVTEVVTRYVTEEFNFGIDLDYNLKTRQERRVRLPMFQGYKSDLQFQLIRENQELDRLVSQSTQKNKDRKVKRALKREIKKQKALIAELLTKSESLNDYISWLRS